MEIFGLTVMFVLVLGFKLYLKLTVQIYAVIRTHVVFDSFDKNKSLAYFIGCILYASSIRLFYKF